MVKDNFTSVYKMCDLSVKHHQKNWKKYTCICFEHVNVIDNDVESVLYCSHIFCEIITSKAPVNILQIDFL